MLRLLIVIYNKDTLFIFQITVSKKVAVHFDKTIVSLFEKVVARALSTLTPCAKPVDSLPDRTVLLYRIGFDSERSPAWRQEEVIIPYVLASQSLIIDIRGNFRFYLTVLSHLIEKALKFR